MSGVIGCIVFVVVFAEGVFAQDVSPTAQAAQLHQVFCSTVSSVTVGHAYLQAAAQDALDQLETLRPDAWAERTQCAVYVDRNPVVQLAAVCLLEPTRQEVAFVGWDHVSTGNPRRSRHYLTPCGIFPNTVAVVGYRALGTKNRHGWRGLGVRGSRVWDFGWQWTEHFVHKERDDRQIRLLLHATDPHQGEARLGRPDSMGCVRVSAAFNRFLDLYGIIDADYEAATAEDPHTVGWLLRSDRTPTQYAGRYLIVGEPHVRVKPDELVVGLR